MADSELAWVIEEYGDNLEAFANGQNILDAKGKSKIDDDTHDEPEDNIEREKAFKLIITLNDLWLAYSLQEGAEEEIADYNVPDTVKETLESFPISNVMELLKHRKRSVRREACWVLSNVTAGTHWQKELVIGQKSCITAIIICS